MTHDESSSPLVPADDAVESSTNDNETLSDIASEQDEQAQKFAAEFLKMVIRLRGVQIDRDDYLRQELRKLGADDDTIALAQETTPVQAGLTPAQLDGLATATIAFETRKSAAISFAAGLPGGFAMLATIPADVTQYYVHAFRVMQKLAYIYGWKDFLGDLDEIDDETLGKMSLFLGVMMGVGGAASSLTTFAKQVARPALQKQIAQQTLTKTAWYGPMKQTLKLIGIKISKDSFAKGVTRTVPVIGGVISGGMTLVALRTQSTRLQKHLRELPPPGVDAAQYLAALDDLDAQADEPGALAAAQAKTLANWMMGELAAQLNRDGLDIADSKVSAPQLAGLVIRIADGTLSGKLAREVFHTLWAEGPVQGGPEVVDALIDRQGLRQISGDDVLGPIIDQVLANNAKSVEEYRAGKEKAFNALVGQVMKLSKGKANPQQVNELLKKKLG